MRHFNIRKFYTPLEMFLYLAAHAQVINIPAEESLALSATQPEALTSEVTVYPVPAGSELTISAPGIFEGETQLLLFNMHGQEFHTQTLSAEAMSNFKLNLDKINLSAGVYYIRLLNGGNTVTRKFIKK